MTQNWDSTDSRQRWTLTRTKDGDFRLKNKATSKALALDGTTAALQSPNAGQNQKWRFKPIVTL